MPKPISSGEVLCLKVAEALSRMEKPDLARADSNDKSVLSKTLYDPNGFARMSAAVAELSKGKVTTRKRTAKDKFQLEVMGAASYFVLEGGGKQQRVIFSGNDFVFEK